MIPHQRLLLLAAFSLLLLGLFSLNQALLAMAVPLLVYLAIAHTTARTELALNVERQVDNDTIYAGDSFNVTLTVTNNGPAIEFIHIFDPTAVMLPAVTGQTEAIAALATGERLTLAYSIPGISGTLDLPKVQITAGETLALASQKVETGTSTQLVVIPDYPRVRSVAIRPLRTHGFAGPINSRQSGSGTDFYGIRPYQPGDPLRQINWRAMARYEDKPITTEFEQERITEIGLILDVRQETALIGNGRSLLTHMIQATASLADVLLRDGHRVGLLTYGQGNWVYPGYGRIQRERILRTLALRQATTQQMFQSLHHLPTQLFPRRSHLILISPLQADDEQSLVRLRAQGYTMMIVSPNPVYFEASQLPDTPILPTATRVAQLERQLLLNHLRQAGIAILDWPITQPLDDLLVAISHNTPPVFQRRSGL